MGLQDYKRKRDFSKTPEPAGVEAPAQGNSFVVQKHAARRLHYDLRLELDGVLKSWAVAAGPSLVPGEKKLAIEVEDHPLDYGGFEGNIPKGEYGGGAVIVWDNGTWKSEGDPRAGLAKGHIRFSLQGKKLGGLWDLVRIKKKPGDRQQPWLLIKVADEHARTAADPNILDEEPRSILSGRTVEEVGAGVEPPKKPAPRAKARTAAPTGAKVAPPATAEAPAAAVTAAPRARSKKPARKPAPAPEVDGEGEPSSQVDPGAAPGAIAARLPVFVEPSLASLATRAPEGAEWVHEVKLDGYRLQVRLDHGRVQLRTRAGLDWTQKFARVAEAFADFPVKQAIFDGEVVVENANGVSSFAELKTELSRTRSDRFLFYAFDVLHLEGYDLTATPFIERRGLLQGVFAQNRDARIRLTELFETEGGLLLRHACRLGLEGIVSKRRNGRYASGRGKGWVKTKCGARQEFVVVGYGPSTTSRKAIGSLALGYYKGEVLAYAGKVGTGFSHAVSEELFEKLDPTRRQGTPVTEIPADADTKGVRWVEPRFVAEVEFREWTGSNLLRHPVFQGLREDKTPQDVEREPAPAASRKSQRAGWRVRLTHPDRVYWPDVGVSKLGLAEYYADVWSWIEPHVARRPLSLLRCPGGTNECFFQKHAWSGLEAKLIHRASVGDDEVLWIDSLDGLVALVQAAVLEIHPWGSPLADAERPDRLIFDLDPGEGVAWPDIESAAVEIRDALAELGLTSFLKTTGGKGLHVVLPIRPDLAWAPAKQWAQDFASLVAARNRKRYVTNMAKAVRPGKIFLDYLRNGRGATAVAAFSTRARPGAPVSTPLAWDELGTGITPAHFTLLNLPRRLQSLRTDPWAGFADLAQQLPALPKP